jgi:uncharacterized membrane protein YfcA
MMLGAMVGVRLLRVVSAATLRRLVTTVLLIAGVRALVHGLGTF